MNITGNIIKLATKERLREIDLFRRHPFAVQDAQLRRLIEVCSETSFGRERSVTADCDWNRYRNAVAISDYEELCPLIDRCRKGEKNLLWPGEINWFAKSSGTTGSKSKYIPVSQAGLTECHMKGPRDVVGLFMERFPQSRAFSGRTLTLGGSKKIEREGDTALSGDLSAILIENTPWYANLARVPSVRTALIPDFEEKVRLICHEAAGKNITTFAGVPSWNLVMMSKVLEYTGKNNLLEVWPNLELFIHGGMNFRPYREQYRQLIPSEQMKYMETYNASEGFFAIGDDLQSDDMLLMLDYGIFYEFLPSTSLHDHSKAMPLEGVTTGVNYAMIISSSNGLWRYMLGDTVEFTSTNPFRIRITGRTKHYINAFGEEIVIDNAERAIRAACDATDSEVAEYTAAPVYMKERGKGSHQWVIEFAKAPLSIEQFGRELDLNLQAVNSDYEAKRFKDTTLDAPLITVVPKGTFLRWMEYLGKSGGQNKVPRLSNERKFVDELLGFTAVSEETDKNLKTEPNYVYSDCG